MKAFLSALLRQSLACDMQFPCSAGCCGAASHKFPCVVQAFLTGALAFACSSGFGQTNCLLVGSTPEANASTLRSVAFDTDRFVAVGDGGIIVLSTNATNWLRQPSPTTSTLYGITFGADRFVSVGDAGSVLQSTNGSDWLSTGAAVTNNFRAVAFGNGQFVALTDDSKLMKSADSITWDRSTNGVPVGRTLYGVYFGGGLFVASGGDGIILVSSDGLNWTNTSVSTASTFKCGAYGNGAFVTAGWGEFGMDQVARSTNGVNWSTARHNMNFSAFCFGGGLLLGVGQSSAEWSPDGNTWTNAYIGEINCLSVAFGLGQYVVVGDGGAIYSSSNLSTWTAQNATVCPIAALASGNGISVGISGNCGKIYSSEDGIHYVQRRGCDGTLTGLDFGNGLFVTAGSVGILVSSDGTNWTSVPYPPIGELPSLRFEQGVWVAAYNGIISSEDGTNWLLRVANPGYLTGLTYGNNRWVGFGWNGAIWSSPDGTNWLDCSFPTSANFGVGIFQGGLFSLYAPEGYLQSPMGLVSNDGINWFDASTSGPLLSLHVDNSSSLTLGLAGEWGRKYLVSGSTDLSIWSDMRTFTNTAGVTSMRVTNSLNATSVFIRAVAQ
ncbi:hypothetical protein GC207_08790 [bacterium]|nr:hypothetical protein [bacterium]